MTLTFGPVWEDGSYADEIQSAKGRSGVYVIRSADTEEILYVGESHTGKLYGTITRHFQEWDGKTAGATYGKHRTEIAIVVLPAGEALELQYDLIGELEPADNVYGQDDEDEEADADEELDVDDEGDEGELEDVPF